MLTFKEQTYLENMYSNLEYTFPMYIFYEQLISVCIFRVQVNIPDQETAN